MLAIVCRRGVFKARNSGLEENLRLAAEGPTLLSYVYVGVGLWSPKLVKFCSLQTVPVQSKSEIKFVYLNLTVFRCRNQNSTDCSEVWFHFEWSCEGNSVIINLLSIVRRFSLIKFLQNEPFRKISIDPVKVLLWANASSSTLQWRTSSSGKAST